MIVELIYVAALAWIIFAFCKWVTLNNNYFEKRGLRYVKPVFIFGNTGGFFLSKYNSPDFVKMLYNKFPNEKIFGFFDLRRPMFFVRDPELIKQLAVKDFDQFEDHRSFIDDKSDALFGNSLFMLKGKKWRDMRATLSPAFTGSKMRQMFELVSETADDLAKYFVSKSQKGELIRWEMKELFSRYTNDVIATAAFGIKVNSFENPDNEFLTTGKRFMRFTSPLGILKVFFLRTLPKLAKALNIEFTEKKVSDFFRSMVLNNMKTREAEGIDRPDMIDILMQVRKGTWNISSSVAQQQRTEEKSESNEDGFATVEESDIGKIAVKRQWTDDEIVAQCFLFFVAGFDTSSTLITFLAYELAINANVQEKLYDEVHATHIALNGKRINYDSLQKMKYMDLVICETLRKWPPAPLTDRMCVNDYTYDDGEGFKFNISKGTAIWIPISALHHDPNYFPEPEKFDPDRFNEDNKHNIISGTYLPFGIGPRNCIGSRFALMEIKAVIYYLLVNFRFVPYEETQIPIKLKKTPLTLATEKGTYLQFSPRVSKETK